MNIKAVTLALSILLGLPIMSGMVWAAIELRMEVASNTSWRVLDIWDKMEAIKKKRRLSRVEWSKWCQAGKDLGVFIVCPKR